MSTALLELDDYRDSRNSAQVTEQQLTSADLSQTIELSIRSKISGRIRWDMPYIRDNEDFAQRLAVYLSDLEDIVEVVANPLTGRVLTKHHCADDHQIIGQYIRDAVRHSLDTDDAQTILDDQPLESPIGVAVETLGVTAAVVTFVSIGIGNIIIFGTAGAVAALIVNRKSKADSSGGGGPYDSFKERIVVHKPKLVVASIFAVSSVIFGLGRFVFIGLAIDKVIKLSAIAKTTTAVQFMTPIVYYGLLSMLMTAIQGWLMFKGQSITLKVAQDIQHDLRQEAYNHVLKVPMHYFIENDRSEIVFTLGEKINELEHILFGGWEIAQLGTAAVAMTILFWVLLSPLWALMIVLSIPALLYGSVILNRRADPLFKQINQQAGSVRWHIAESISGIETVKSYTAEDEQLERLQLLSSIHVQGKSSIISLTSAYRPIFELIVMGVTVLTLIASSASVFAGSMGVGAFFLLVMAVRQLFWPLTQFGRVYELGQSGWTAYTRVLDLLNLPIEEIDRGQRLIKPIKGCIELKNVDFRYEPEVQLLSDINVKFPVGKTTAIVGPTGCGKSTLINLLLCFYQPGHGEIKLDGQNYQDVCTRDIRESIAFVSQEAFFFNGSVQENLKFGSPNSTDKQIQRASEIACADEFIQRLPNRYQETIGEKGLKLSGGQRQRLSIARAILKNAPILILDEATSSVDNDTQAIIQRRLAEALSTSTQILVAHRLTTISNADNIIVLNHGKVVQSGNHRSLIEQEGLYRHLWNVQRENPDAQ